VVIKRLVTFAAVVATLGCTLGKQDAPGLTGPSELGLSLSLSATPDQIDQDGSSRSTISVQARDGNNQPVSGLTLKVEIVSGGFYVDFGSLSSRTMSTGADGRASVTYTAPPVPPVGTGSVVISVLVTPISNNYANANPRNVDIRLTPPGLVVPPNGSPVARLFITPLNPRAGDTVNFDGSNSFDDDGTIVSYEWRFGDGNTATGKFATHVYDLPGQYLVFLTVTDNQGLKASSAPISLTVGATQNPTANFSFSPSPAVAGQDVHFNGSTSTAVDGRTIVSYRWDFGDIAGPNRFAEGQTVSHIFGAPGTYNVVLTVTDDTGRTGSVSRAVSIVPPTEP
jgi:PKD repeat protein